MMWENVVPSSIQARKDVLALFGMPALTSEGAVFEAARRLRWFITNLRLERISDEILDKKLDDIALMKTEKTAVVRILSW